MTVKTQELRQGDVFLATLPKGHKIRTTTRVSTETGRTILAHGELTGHAHALPEFGVELYEIDLDVYGASFGEEAANQAKAANTRLLRVLKTVDLLHEEHAPIRLEPGNYLVSIQLQFNEDEDWELVQD